MELTLIFDGIIITFPLFNYNDAGIKVIFNTFSLIFLPSFSKK